MVVLFGLSFQLRACSYTADEAEHSWLEFFDDPTQWWDNRAKNWKSSPHFKHVQTGKGLWINSVNCPAWVHDKLTSLKHPSPSKSSTARYLQETGGTTIHELVTQLRECGRSRDVNRGRQVHSRAILAGLSCNKYVFTSLMNMYSKCRCMVCAQVVFDGLLHRDAVSWTALIMGYVEYGEGEMALELYDSMEAETQDGAGLHDARMYVAVLTCLSTLVERNHNARRGRWLEKGKRIHSRALAEDCCDTVVMNALLGLYSKCGSMVRARNVFDSMQSCDLVSWNVLLHGYVTNGESKLTLELFECMKSAQTPDSRTYVATLTACTALATKEGWFEHESWLRRGKEIHSQAVESHSCDIFVECTLVDMYGKCGRMEEARSVFDNMSERNVVAWNALLQGYLQNGESELALEMFGNMERLERRRLSPDARTYAHALAACAALAGKQEEADSDTKSRSQWLEEGKRIYSRAIKTGCCDIYVENNSINMFAKCGSMACARRAFDQMVVKNIVSWNCLVQGYVDSGENRKALELLEQMSLVKNSQTFVAALTACGNLMESEGAKAYVEEIRNRGLEQDLLVANCLVDFYGKYGDMEAAKQVFDSIPRKDVVSWNGLICGYSLQGHTSQVFDMFEKMREQGVRPDDITFICILTACSHAGLTDKGRELFSQMNSEFGVRPRLKHYACMVDLLGRANLLDEAVKMLRGMPMEPNAAIWRSLLSACSKWKNIEVARLAYERLLDLDGTDASACVLMSSIYKTLGMKDCERTLNVLNSF